MAFAPEASVSPVSIRDISVHLFDPDPNGSEARSATTNVQIVMSDGSLRLRKFNLTEHFAPAVIAQLIDFVNAIRTKAENEILPEAN